MIQAEHGLRAPRRDVREKPEIRNEIIELILFLQILLF